MNELQLSIHNIADKPVKIVYFFSERACDQLIEWAHAEKITIECSYFTDMAMFSGAAYLGKMTDPQMMTLKLMC